MKLRILVIFFLVSFTGCITQEKNFKNFKNDVIEPELDDEEFINLVNNILVEKVTLDMFFTSSGRSLHIINTYDCNGKEIRVSIIRYMNELYISVDPGHFTSMPPVPEAKREPYNSESIDVKGLFTPQIENQVDLTPPPTFFTRRTYDIVVMGYKGTLVVVRGHVSIYVITGPLPTAPPDSNILYVAGVLLVLILSIIVLKKRKTLKERWFT